MTAWGGKHGMGRHSPLDSRLRGNDGVGRASTEWGGTALWIPACAGMTAWALIGAADHPLWERGRYRCYG